MPRNTLADGRSLGRAVFRASLTFFVACGCVQWYANSGPIDPIGSEGESLRYAETKIEAPPPSQLNDWSYQVAGSSLSTDEWNALATRAIGIRGRVNGGDSTWVETVVALESPFFKVDDRLACASRYGLNVQSSCDVRFDIGIQRESRTDGRVVYSRATQIVETATDTERSTCERFLKCMARSKLGGTVPIPTDDWSDIVVYQLVSLQPMSDDLRNPENLKVGAQLVDEQRRQLEQQIHDAPRDQTAYLQALIQHLDNKARYYRLRATELESNEAQ